MDSNKSTSVTNAADKQCKHKYSSFPYCYDEIKMIDAPTEAAHSINFVRIPHTGGSDNQSHHHHAHHHHPHHHHNHNSDHHSHEHHRHDVGEHLTELDNQSPAMSLDVGELDCLDCRMHKQHELTTPATAHVTSHHNGKILREKVDERNENTTSVGAAAGAVCGDVTERNRMLDATDKDDEVEEEGRQHGGETDRDSVEYTVILREHHTGHHGHSHSHGHVHAAPNSMSAVAWMVIMGDGLHNFTDGMAIGAAFSDDITGGFSTALAVFCHELPHELGDFAMLLKAGMSMRQALFYNLMSSVLCVAGNIFGIWLGNTPEATSWVFAAAAGMFLYIALVDMIPELSSGHDDVDDGSTLMQCVLHLGGLLVGFGIMMLIACYEHELTHVFNNAL